MKKMSILTKLILHIALFVLPLISFGQEVKGEVWKSEKEYLKYKKGEKYKGPNDWYGSVPSDIKDEEYIPNSGSYGSGNYNPYTGSSSSSSGKGIQYSRQQIQKDRQKRYQGFDRGGGKGNLKFDPKVERPDPIEVPDVDAPDIDLPDVDLDLDIDAPSISPSFWKVLFFIFIFAAVMIIAYLIIKNRKPVNKKVIVDVENDWNPEVISKTELELKLEAAEAKGDYRECVRIYFTFILKELIRKGWIRWKKEKTNHHYVMEMSGKPNVLSFMESVRIYDLVWYGEYQIDEDIYELLRPEMETYYKSLDPVDE